MYRMTAIQLDFDKCTNKGRQYGQNRGLCHSLNAYFRLQTSRPTERSESDRQSDQTFDILGVSWSFCRSSMVLCQSVLQPVLQFNTSEM